MKRIIYILTADRNRNLLPVPTPADVIYYREHPFAIHRTLAPDPDPDLIAFVNSADPACRWTVTDCITGLCVGTAPSKRLAIRLLHEKAYHIIYLLRSTCNNDGFREGSGIYNWFMRTWRAYFNDPGLDGEPYKLFDISKEYSLFIERNRNEK